MKYVFLLFALVSISVCTYSQSSDLVGTWTVTNPEGQTASVHFKEDGTYEVDLDGDSEMDVSGKYDVNGDQVTVQDTDGKEGMTCPTETKGVYTIKIEGDKSTFTKVSDDCERIGNEPVVFTKA